MKRILLIGCFLCFSLNAFEEEKVIEQLKIFQSRHGQDKHSSKCSSSTIQASENSFLLVFVSFSMPDGVWLSLSKDIEKVGGIFVLQGLPNNNFKDLATNIFHLRQIGVNADIQLHPPLFERYQVNKVPTFVVIDGEKWDKISGAIPLETVLKEIQMNGEGKKALSLLEKLQGGI